MKIKSIAAILCFSLFAHLATPEASHAMTCDFIFGGDYCCVNVPPDGVACTKIKKSFYLDASYSSDSETNAPSCSVSI